MQPKDYKALVVAKISKKQLKEKHPEWIVRFGPIEFIKNEAKELLRKELLKVLYKRIKDQKYKTYEDVVIRETENDFVAFTLTIPTQKNLRIWNELETPQITRDEFIRKAKKILDTFSFRAVSPDEIVKLNEKYAEYKQS